jgi:hypothetical protein
MIVPSNYVNADQNSTPVFYCLTPQNNLATLATVVGIAAGVVQIVQAFQTKRGQR